MKIELTTEQREAIERFAAKHGRTWKSELRARWMGRNGGVSGELQNLRHCFETTRWLERFKL